MICWWWLYIDDYIDFFIIIIIFYSFHFAFIFRCLLHFTLLAAKSVRAQFKQHFDTCRSSTRILIKYLPAGYYALQHVQSSSALCCERKRQSEWEREKINLKHITRTQAMRILQADFIIYFCFVLSVCICISYFVFAVWQIYSNTHTHASQLVLWQGGGRAGLKAYNVTALRPFGDTL